MSLHACHHTGFMEVSSRQHRYTTKVEPQNASTQAVLKSQHVNPGCKAILASVFPRSARSSSFGICA